LKYLKENTSFEMLVVLRQEKIDYPAFYDLRIPYKLLTKNYKPKDLTLHWKFYKICQDFKPDLIHSWGKMPAFVSLLTVILKGIPLVNSQITSAPPHIETLSFNNLTNKINFKLSDVILSNSEAGLHVYNPPFSKSKVIYNGINLSRFEGLPPADQIRKKNDIKTKYLVVMVASFSENKDYRKFLNVCQQVSKKREDITFVAAGDGKYLKTIRAEADEMNVKNIRFTGRITNVEELIHASDIGMLLTNKTVHGEGISNAIMEYMALGKPVIANDAGGTKEIVEHNKNGYLITGESVQDIAEMIIRLIEDNELRKQFGETGKTIIHEKFSLEKMGRSFEELYDEVLMDNRVN